MSGAQPRGVLVGAYAASPAFAHWDAALERTFYDGLDAVPEVRGLELPWTGTLHPHDDGWLLAHFPRRFDAVLTAIPGTMRRLQTDPGYGLASTDPDGRGAAVREALALRDAARRLDDACGRAAVVAVELPSAPRATGTADALRRSLGELVEAGGWDATAIVVEHCDAFAADRPVEKGFLTVADELEALRDLPAGVGMSVNWGRSAIELRDPDRVAGQIGEVAAAGRLHGLMFSGASAEATAFGGPWVDAHHPLAPTPGFPGGEAASLLTLERLESAAAAAVELRWAGFKFGWADPNAPVAPRVEMIAAAARIVSSVTRGEVSVG